MKNELVSYFENKLNFEINSYDLFVEMSGGSNLILIDARPKEVFETEHIPGAISFPHRMMTAESTVSLDKNVLYVTYCDGIGCNASTKGARNLAKLGFNVKELIGGLDWWKRDGYATEGKSAQSGKDINCNC